MAQKNLNWQEKSVSMPDWTKSGAIYYWQNPDFDNKKPTIVMVHGFRGDHHGLTYIAEDFIKLDNSKHNIILIDLPAYGKSAEFLNAKSHTATHYADFLAAFINKIELKKPIMVGHSFGTIILSRFLAKYPNLSNGKTVLLSPIAKRPQMTFGTKAINAFADFVKILPNGITHPIASSNALSDLVTYSWSTTRDRRVYENITKREHREYFGVFSSMDAMLATMKSANTDSVSDVIVDLSKAERNILMVVGTKDKLVTVEDARNLSGQLKAELVEITDLGHLIHYEAYDEVARKIKSFLG